jgi:hypothetical protein
MRSGQWLVASFSKLPDVLKQVEISHAARSLRCRFFSGEAADV